MAAEIGKSESVPVITFGSHGLNEAVNGSHLPKNAVDEWPTAQQVHSFYFVRYRTYDDPKIKAKLDAADRDLQNMNQARSLVYDKLQAIRSKRRQISDQITPLSDENNKIKSILDGKLKEMEPLNQALNQLRPNKSNREKGSPIICSSEEELDKLIKSHQYRIQHENITLSEEKQILREIKQLEGTRKKVIEKAAERAKIEEALGGKEAIQDQVNLMGDGFSGVKKERKLITAKLTQLMDERKAIDGNIAKIEIELKAATEKRDKARLVVQGLRKQLDDMNACVYQNRGRLNLAKNHAYNKDVAALKDLSNSELEKFMKMWNESKALRDDYERRILGSLDNHQLSRDRRIRNADEKRLVVLEPSKSEPITESKPKQAKSESVSTEKSHKEPKSKAVKEAKNKLIEAAALDDEEEVFETIKPKEVEKVDEKKLKEMRREEEIAKAKQALERKKKLAEKAAAKAAIKAQKEAEKKLKDREKKLKKKASASGLVSEPEEQPLEEKEKVAEPEEAAEEPVIPKSKGGHVGTIRNRNRSKGNPDTIAKAKFNRKKSSTNYGVWAVPAAISVMMIFVIGYKYLI